MEYQEAVRYLLSLGRELAAPRQARVQKFDLGNIRALGERMGRPHRAVPCAHIAGTNGKGSTALLLDSILRAAGYRSGLYTSPHLVRINERIRVDGEEISDADFATAFTRVQTLIEQMLASGELAAHPTYFECVTAMAFEHFTRAGAGFAVYEVGMGGRLDSTNIVEPEVAVITQVDFDHEEYLGHSIEQIAEEKAGIIKPGAWVVSAAENAAAAAVIRQRAREQNAHLVEALEDYRIADVKADVRGTRFTLHCPRDAWSIELRLTLPGRYQLRNALAAVAAARVLAARGFAVDDGAISRGIAAARWPGRLQQVQERPAVFLDGTHNPAGAKELVEFWKEQFAGRKIHLLFGAMRDKAVDEIAGLLYPKAETVIATAPHQARAISPQALAEITGHLARRIEVVPEPEEALERAMELAGPDDIVFATGSLYLVGDLLRHWSARGESKTSQAAHESGRSSGR
jgi:dihydrofolate synthase/folylpolyglutamate synthase